MDYIVIPPDNRMNSTGKYLVADVCAWVHHGAYVYSSYVKVDAQRQRDKMNGKG